MAVLFADVLKAHGFKRDLRVSVRGVCQAAQQKENRLLAIGKSSLLFSFVFACVVAIPQAAHASVGVWLQSPKPGSNPNTFRVYATAYSPSAVTGWVIYVDDAVAYRTNNSSDTLSRPTEGILFTRAHGTVRVISGHRLRR